jgi:hypothetical protein
MIRRVGMPRVEVVAPDGSREIWVVAVEHSKALDAVKRKLPLGYTARLVSGSEYQRTSRMKGLHYGQMRKIER